MSTAPAAPTLAQLTLGDFAQEVATTRRVLERVPQEHWDWKPHPKSMSLGQLTGHIANLLGWGEHILTQPEVDFASPPSLPRHPDQDAVLASFDARASTVGTGLGGVSDQTLAESYTVRRGEQVFTVMPRAAMMRAMVLSHIIHHRGQLTVYLRLLDVPVPPVYGPTADESSF